METLYLLKFNNYYNRKIKKFDTIDEYADYTLGQPIININFIENDGVDTEQIINWNGDNPDYLVVIDQITNTIQSRWFVMDYVRTRNGQYKLSLHRDVISDNYNIIIHSPCFIEKATLQPDNNLIFNSENMTYNQIKQSETLIKDKSNTPWIVGYVASYDGKGAIPTLSGTTVKNDYADINRTDISSTEWEFAPLYYEYKDLVNDIISVSVNYTCNNGYGTFKYTNYTTICYFDYQISYNKVVDTSYRQGYTVAENDIDSVKSLDFYKWYSFSLVKDALIAQINALDLSAEELLSYNNKTILFSDGLFEIKVNSQPSIESVLSISNSGEVFDYLNPITTSRMLSDAGASVDASISTPPFYNIKYDTQKYSITLNRLSQNIEGNNYLVPTTRAKLTDAPYDMFILPYNSISVITGSETFTTDSSISLNIAMDIARKYAGANVLYDIQLLPYCPMYNILTNNNGEINITTLDEGVDYSFVTDNVDDTKTSIILFPKVSSFSEVIPLDNPVVIKDYKIESETDLYRLCSPNYNGIFEFNAAKNGGIQYFNVNCTYMPYTPYIRVAPNFGRLYGSEFNDSRGLLCGGDFSLPIVTSAWETYQLQNKNYQASFDRQIQNMEVMNNIQDQKDVISSILGTIKGGLTGAATGGLSSGKLIGAGVGAVVGGIASGIAGAYDLSLNRQIRSETLDYTKDQFGYQLGNIQALPNSISKTTAYTINNKIFPFLEYYTCSDVEKEALRNKIKYNGMTVMAIGTVSDYITSTESYIKGKLIRIEDYEDETFVDDYHMTNAIYQELDKGIFIGE